MDVELKNKLMRHYSNRSEAYACYIILYYTILCYTILYYTIPYYTMLFSSILHQDTSMYRYIPGHALSIYARSRIRYMTRINLPRWEQAFADQTTNESRAGFKRLTTWKASRDSQARRHRRDYLRRFETQIQYVEGKSMYMSGRVLDNMHTFTQT
jgi:hypothetical protein